MSRAQWLQIVTRLEGMMAPRKSASEEACMQLRSDVSLPPPSRASSMTLNVQRPPPARPPRDREPQIPSSRTPITDHLMITRRAHLSHRRSCGGAVHEHVSRRSACLVWSLVSPAHPSCSRSRCEVGLARRSRSQARDSEPPRRVPGSEDFQETQRLLRDTFLRFVSTRLRFHAVFHVRRGVP